MNFTIERVAEFYELFDWDTMETVFASEDLLEVRSKLTELSFTDCLGI